MSQRICVIFSPNIHILHNLSANSFSFSLTLGFYYERGARSYELSDPLLRSYTNEHNPLIHEYQFCLTRAIFSSAAVDARQQIQMA